MFEANSAANTALSRATKEANDALTQLQHDFITAKKAFQDQVSKDLETSHDQTLSFLERLLKGMDTAVQGAIGKVVAATTDLESETASMADVCGHNYLDVALFS